MTLSPHDALTIVALLAAGLGLLVAAHLVRIPYPILLVLGGLALGFIPGVPHLHLNPELVLVGILPPLLYATAFYTPLREIHKAARSISSLAFGLVFATIAAVAAVAHYAIDMPWPVAFVLGAIVAPTDPVAATAIADRIGLPRNLVVMIEGEGLLNDATALTAYRFAVAAVVGGGFSLMHATWEFVVAVVGGIGVGLAVGFLIRQLRRRIDHSPTEVAIALFSGYLAYLPAEALHVSAVLAAVTVGVYVGWYTPELTNARTRLQGEAVWEIVTFVVNALLFTLVGLQLRTIVSSIHGHSLGTLVAWGALISGVVIGVRLLWVYGVTYLQWWVFPRIRSRERFPNPRAVGVVAWTGMRGGVTLAAALALPLTTDNGSPFPDRSLVVFLAFAVIVATLVLQGLSLQPLVRMFDLPHREDTDQETAARLYAAEAALDRLDELATEDWARDDAVQRLRDSYAFRQGKLSARYDDAPKLDRHRRDFERLRRQLIDAERGALLELQRRGQLEDEVLQRVRRELDIEETRLGG
jgi:CPA1 family monovalent cation:H+ antiporter